MPASAGRKRREERVKLGASALANLGSAFIVGGAVGPSLLGRLNPVALAVSLVVGVAFHAAGQGLLHYVATDAAEEIQP